jgi:cell division protein ZapA (FtsZ GTPase activity inhibitor)
MSSNLPVPSHASPIVAKHHLDQITEREATLFNIIEQSTLATHRKLKKAMAELKDKGEELTPLELSLIATRLDRSLKTTYELLELKGRIHDNKRGPGIIRARVGIRTDDGRETVAEVQVQP